MIELVVVLTFGSLFSIGEGKPIGGLGYAYKHNTCDDLKKLKPNWYYGWDYNQTCTNNNTIPWIPMIKDKNATKYAHTLKGGNYEAVLGFNEPDAKNQSNLTVPEALDLWPNLIDIGLPLCSPATTRFGWFSWAVNFTKGAKERGYRVDFLCFHFYVAPKESVDEGLTNLKKALNQLRKTPEFIPYTKNGSIWITEFADHHNNVTGNKEFFNRAYELFTGNYSDMIGKYAWFTNRQSPNNAKNNVNGTYAWDLIDPKGDLTKLGQDYKSKIHQ